MSVQMVQADERLLSRHARPTAPCGKRRYTPGFEETDAALEAWARWARTGLAGLGWPARTLLARIIECGVRGAAQAGCLTVEIDEAMEMVERAVLRLSDLERQTICRHYLYWQPPEVSARYCGMSPNYFGVVLHRARRSIRDYLEGVKAARATQRLHY
jgi:DNA-directed RNA polymerase specialized sigma24 family protein